MAALFVVNKGQLDMIPTASTAMLLGDGMYAVKMEDSSGNVKMKRLLKTTN